MTTDHELADLRRSLHATEQAGLDLEAELAHAEPAAEALHAYCAANLAGMTAEDLSPFHNQMFIVHAATTPSPVPSSHVIVERARLERLEAIEKAANKLALTDAPSGFGPAIDKLRDALDGAR